MRFAAGVEYDGSRFHGWQSQGDVRTVQDAVEAAFSQVADHAISVVTAGRTDAGVHAMGQVVHFDSDAQRSNYSWQRGANTHLPRDVVITWVRPVSDDFHARFSALERAYRYIIYNRPQRSACFFSKVSMEYRPLNLSRMQQAAEHLVGEFDFSSFRAAGCQAHSPVREIRSMELMRELPFIYLDVRANAFLQ
ncbi:MAG: tRNA pseudouridine(38-40) synthase TruA, partial [Gammaproteobacteria bacterium]